MRQTSELYKQLRAQTGSYYEVKVVRGDVTYGMDKLKSIKIRNALFEGSGPQVGGVNSSQCVVKLLEQSSNWPRMASFEVKIRLSSENGEQKSEWLSIGSFYTDERHADKYGNLEIIGFDGMLLLERPWTDSVSELPAQWPVTSAAAVEMISEATGVQIDESTVLDDTVPFIGLDTKSTARSVLSAVAAGNGGNWYLNSVGKLVLKSLWNFSAGTSAVADIAIADVAIVNTGFPSSQSGNSGYRNIERSVVDIKAGDATGGVTGVELETDNGVVASAYNGDSYVLKASCNFADSAVAGLCLERVFGYSYKPFEAVGARVDPALEVGDAVSIDGNVYQVMVIDWNIGPHITATLSAPYEEAVDHEYSMMSESAKTLRKAMGYTDNQIEQTRSYIQQTEQSITQGVAANYVSNQALGSVLSNYSPTAEIQRNYYSKSETDSRDAALASEIELTDSRLTLAFSELRTDVNDEINAMSYYIRYENGVVIVGKTDSPTSIRISNEQIALYYNNEMLSYWNQNKQYTPKELQIPAGGKFTLGSILFQPRTSGNMSLLWVGGSTNGN